jgi:hypothetical protein
MDLNGKQFVIEEIKQIYIKVVLKFMVMEKIQQKIFLKQ